MGNLPYKIIGEGRNLTNQITLLLYFSDTLHPSLLTFSASHEVLRRAGLESDSKGDTPLLHVGLLDPLGSDVVLHLPIDPVGSDVVLRLPIDPSGSDVVLRLPIEPIGSDVVLRLPIDPTGSDVVLRLPIDPVGSDVVLYLLINPTPTRSRDPTLS